MMHVSLTVYGSAKAAKDLRILIERSVSSIGRGNERVQHAGTTMEEIIFTYSSGRRAD
jgi:hypothetical protein